MKKLFIGFIFAIATLVACDKDVIVGPTVVINGHDYAWPQYTTPQNEDGEFAITFGGYTASKIATKALAVSTLNNGYDEFNLYGWNSLNETIMNPFKVSANANGYVYEGINGQELQYFKNNASHYEFLGVIPTDKNETLANGVLTVENIESATYDDKRAEGGALAVDSPEEMLWSYAKVEKANYGSTVTLPFNHGNALLYLGFKSDRNDTEIIDYVPGIPGTPAVPATPDTETYTSKSTRFIDELVAGNEVQVGIGFYGASSPKLTSSQPNPLYVGTDNTGNGWLAKTWLLSIKDAVNSQFVYYRLDQVTNSTSKTETTEDWESAASNKNIFMMKLAPGVNATDFANGNDAFWNALVAHETDWVGGSPATSFKSTFQKAYDEGWRVIRINVSDTNANQVMVFLSNNQQINTQVCTVVPGNPGSPAVPATPGIEGIRVFTAKSEMVGGDVHYVHQGHTTVADAAISSTGLVFTSTTTSTNVIPFSLPATTVFGSEVFSPTTFYGIPADPEVTHIVVKFSYTYDGQTVYDVRVPIALPAAGFEAGKYYKYIINITSTANGTNDPNEANTDQDDIDTVTNPVINVIINVTDYSEGANQTVSI